MCYLFTVFDFLPQCEWLLPLPICNYNPYWPVLVRDMQWQHKDQPSYSSSWLPGLMALSSQFVPLFMSLGIFTASLHRTVTHGNTTWQALQCYWALIYFSVCWWFPCCVSLQALSLQVRRILPKDDLDMLIILGTFSLFTPLLSKGLFLPCYPLLEHDATQPHWTLECLLWAAHFTSIWKISVSPTGLSGPISQASEASLLILVVPLFLSGVKCL